MGKRAPSTRQVDFNRGFWQADADLKSGESCLSLYKSANQDFRAGYKMRLELDPELRS